MRYVQRDEQKKVVGSYANLQPGYAEEQMAEDHPDLVRYNTPPPPRIMTPREKVEAALGITVAELRAELARP